MRHILKAMLPASLCLICLLLCEGANAYAQAPAQPRVDVRLITDEADAVLRILSKREGSQEITEEDWQTD